MKKNYITHLQEYDAKTSALSKQDKYRKKYLTTVYYQDKENVNPNIIPTNSKKKQQPKYKKQNHKMIESLQNRINT